MLKSGKTERGDRSVAQHRILIDLGAILAPFWEPFWTILTPRSHPKACLEPTCKNDSFLMDFGVPRGGARVSPVAEAGAGSGVVGKHHLHPKTLILLWELPHRPFCGAVASPRDVYYGVIDYP